MVAMCMQLAPGLRWSPNSPKPANRPAWEINLDRQTSLGWIKCYFVQQSICTEITHFNYELAVVFPNSLVNIYRFVCFCIVCVCSWQRRTLMPTAGCIRAGIAAITLMKESQMEPAGTLFLRVGYILHTTVLIQLLQQGLWFCLI